MTKPISSRSELSAELVKRQPSLSIIDLQSLPDADISSQTPNTYNIANTDRVREMLADTIIALYKCSGAPPKLLRDLFRSVSSESTAVGFLAQFQGYNWFLKQSASIAVEIKHPNTVRGVSIDLDGRIDAGNHSIFFDIKSFGFEPDLRNVFRERLEERIEGYQFTISGPGNHGPAIIRAEAFSKLKEHVTALQIGEHIHIPNLNWKIVKHRRVTGVTAAEHEYNPVEFIRENQNVPLSYSSQFTTDKPYILMFVVPDGVGSSPIKANIFGFAEQVMSGIAKHTFAIGRNDQRSADIFDSSVPQGFSVSDVIALLSGVAFYSPQVNLSLLHLNDQATFPITKSDALKIASSWQVTRHP